MENTCKLCAKCLKKDEPLDKCNNPECQNVIHSSCFNKLLVAFAEEEWEALSFVVNDASMPTRRCKRLQQTR